MFGVFNKLLSVRSRSKKEITVQVIGLMWPALSILPSSVVAPHHGSLKHAVATPAPSPSFTHLPAHVQVPKSGEVVEPEPCTSDRPSGKAVQGRPCVCIRVAAAVVVRHPLLPAHPGGDWFPGTEASGEVSDAVEARQGESSNDYLSPGSTKKGEVGELFGRNNSVSFKKKSNLSKPLMTLPAFVPNLLKLDVIKGDEKYKAFDHIKDGGKELAAASQTLKPQVTYFDGAVMIADVKGFTQLTEILSKKGAVLHAYE